MTLQHTLVVICDECGTMIKLPTGDIQANTERLGWLTIPKHVDAFNAREPRVHYCPACRRYHAHETGAPPPKSEATAFRPPWI